MSSPSTPHDERLDALWRAALDRWNVDATHNALLEAARTTGQLGKLAALYRAESERSERENDAARSASAKRRLGAITIVAMSEIDAQQSSNKLETPPATRQRAVLLLLLASLLALVVPCKDELFG
jgi:hypothetical protein